MKSTALIVTTLALLAPAMHAADEYRWELGAGYVSATDDGDDDLERTAILGRARYQLLAPVSLAEGPWEEADFLAHSTWLEANGGWLTLENDLVDAAGPTYGLAGRYASKEVPIAIDGSVDWTSLEDDDLDFSIDSLSWEVRAGYWIMPNLIAGLGYEWRRTESDLGALSGSSTVDTPFAWGKWVQALNADLDLNVEAEVGQIRYDDDAGENIDVDLAADLYVAKRFGIGVAVGSESGDVAAAEGVTLGATASAWFTENIGLRLGYVTFAASDEDEADDSDAVVAELVGRF